MTGVLEPHVADALRASDMRIVVAGAGGWIGLATLDLLKAAFGEHFADRVHCFGSNDRTLTLRDGTSVAQRPLREIASLPPAPTILLHLAFLTKDRAEAMDEAAYRAANRAIDDQVLGALDMIGTKAVFIASSGAATRADDPAATPAMRLYGALKREQEARFADWADRTGSRVVIARIFNLSGPYINKQASYAIAAFIRDALAGGPVRVRAAHRVIRSYVAIRELMSLVFALLLDSTDDITRFDSGGEPLEMQAIAQAVAQQLPPSAIHRPALDPLIVDEYVGDSGAYLELLARHRIAPVPFALQVSETVEYLSFSGEPETRDRLALNRPA